MFVTLSGMFSTVGLGQPGAKTIRHTARVAWIAVQAGQDHLLQFRKRAPVEALSELVWNALDAEATEVEVEIFSDSLSPTDGEMFYATRVEIRDNGHGITPSIATKAFPSLGDSWKKSLGGRTVNQRRALHGSRGRGRFFAYALGHRVRWTSIAEVGDGSNGEVVIEGDVSSVNGFNILEAVSSNQPTGTLVAIEVEPGRSLPGLLHDDLGIQIAARLAAHLLGNSDIVVRVNGLPIDARALVEGAPHDITLDEIDSSVLGGREVPVLTIVEWIEDMRRPLGLVLCTAGGASLKEVPGSAISGPVRVTGYLKWSGFADSDLSLPELEFTSILDAARSHLDAFVKGRTEDLTVTIVTTLKEEGAYPYPDDVHGAVAEVERDAYDLVVVTARNTLLASTRAQRGMSAKLLHLALQERPQGLDEILRETLRLSADQMNQLTEMLRYSSLGAIVEAATEVGRRLELLLTLRHLLYDSDESKRLREVDQLHPLVKDNVWLFGEDWRLTRSEAGITTILRDVLKDENIAIEADLVQEGSRLLVPEPKRGRVDLLLQRTLNESQLRRRLVVELKRPTVRIGESELAQVKRYARGLAAHPGGGTAKWSFYVVGASCSDEIDADMNQANRAWGHVIEGDYDVRVTTWSHLLNEAERRLEFYQTQLQYDIEQDEAVARVRARHATLLGQPHGTRRTRSAERPREGGQAGL
jgi:Histidine kinase-, DNA gyrase B-, and HSP90-like ATPase